MNPMIVRIGMPLMARLALSCLWVWSAMSSVVTADEAWRARLEQAGENRQEIETAWQRLAADMRPGLEFLVTHMPARDLQQLSADYLVENCQLAYQAWRSAAWHAQIDEALFFNEILPYACVNEVRDSWRRKFFEELRPLVQQCQTPSQAAVTLNQQIFSKYKVQYSTQRRKAIQSPAESMENGLASCSGLSIMLVDACRAVGVPARFVGVPRWVDNSGNHSWVEIWDGEWKFTGAAEPSGDQLNATWFNGRAAQQRRDDPLYAIYAASFRETPVKFPMFSRRADSPIFAVNVTDRYTAQLPTLSAEQQWLRVRAVEVGSQQRVIAQVQVRDEAGQVLGEGRTRDEGFDRNDHWSCIVPKSKSLELAVTWAEQTQRQTIRLEGDSQLVTVRFAAPQATQPLDALREYLLQPRGQRPPLSEQAFAQEAITVADAEVAKQLLWDDFAAEVRETRAAEMEAKKIKWQDWEMPFAYSIHGEAPATGRRLFISMHGGGEAPPRVNNQQWENQKRLYTPEEGVYLAPRAPTDSWNMWHQAHIDPLYDRLITNLIVFENVDPNRVYLLGYSAGGDGVYQVAPRMADRFAAAAMMAGHPNEAQPWSLRNLPFTIHMGAKDAAFKRNEVAANWGKQLEQLRQEDPQGYESFTKLHEGKGHWMERQDAEAIAWLSARARNAWPNKIVWYQDDVTHDRFYWLQLPPGKAQGGTTVRAECEGQSIRITAPPELPVGVLFDGKLIDLNRPIEIKINDQVVFSGKIAPTIGTISKSLQSRGDPATIAIAEWNHGTRHE